MSFIYLENTVAFFSASSSDKNLSDSNLTYLNFGNGSIFDKKNNTIYIKGSGFDTKLTNYKTIAVWFFSIN